MPPKFARTTDSSDRHGARDVERQALLDADSDEDDFFLHGPKVTAKNVGDPKIGRLRGQVDEVVGVMKNNVTKVIERGDRLEDLQDKSDSLANNSDMFRSRAKALHKTMWWKNCKSPKLFLKIMYNMAEKVHKFCGNRIMMRLIMVFVILLILSIIIIPIVVSQVNKNKGG